jgi:phosphoglycolate phosphatase
MSPDSPEYPPHRDSIVVVASKQWMKVIKALARWRWRA